MTNNCFKYNGQNIMFVMDRNKRLSTINALLINHGINPIRKIGNSRDGEIEILSICDIIKTNYVSFVIYYVQFPNMNIEKHVHTETNEPLVEDILIINGYYVVIKKWELNAQRYMFRFLSGFRFNAFSDKEYKSLQNIGVPVKAIKEKIGQLLLSKMSTSNTIVHVLTNKNLLQNSGISSIETERKVINLSLSEKDFEEIKQYIYKTHGTEETNTIKTKVYLMSEKELLEKIKSNRDTGHFDDVSMSTFLSYMIYKF